MSKFKDDNQRKAYWAQKNQGNGSSRSKSTTKGMQTANIVPEYHRPGTRKIATDSAKNLIKLPYSEKIGTNIWLLGKPYKERYKGAHTQEVLIRNKDGYYKFEVPTTKNGSIPPRVIAARILDLADGNRTGRPRSVKLDVGINAENVYELDSKDDRDDVLRWYLHPNESDIKLMDDKQTKILEILKKTKSGKRSVLIVGGSKAQRGDIAQAIEKNFTVAEKKVIAGNLITIGNTRAGVAGYYSQQTDKDHNPLGCAEIRINSKYANEKGSDVVIHECIHLLRDHDKTRDPKIRAVKHYRGRDKDLEESMTEAETVGRQKPLTKHENGTGYYRYVASDKTTKETIIDDRIVITEPKDKDNYLKSGRKGKSVQKKVLKNYPKTHISKMKMAGNVEAIDSFYKSDNRIGQEDVKTHTQIYSPNGNSKSEKDLDQSMKKTGKKVSKWDDGKKRKLK